MSKMGRGTTGAAPRAGLFGSDRVCVVTLRLFGIAIFDTAMDICDQGKSLFKDEPAIREKFIWDNLL